MAPIAGRLVAERLRPSMRAMLAILLLLTMRGEIDDQEAADEQTQTIAKNVEMADASHEFGARVGWCLTTGSVLTSQTIRRTGPGRRASAALGRPALAPVRVQGRRSNVCVPVQSPRPEHLPAPHNRTPLRRWCPTPAARSGTSSAGRSSFRRSRFSQHQSTRSQNPALKGGGGHARLRSQVTEILKEIGS